MTVFWSIYALIGIIVATATISAVGLSRRKGIMEALAILLAWLALAMFWPLASALYIGARIK